MSDEKAVKPGVKTSEFWICSVVAVIGAIAGFLPPEVEGEPTTLEVIRQIVGFIMTTASGLGYAYVRGSVKKTAKVLVFALVLPLLLTGCLCTLEKKAVDNLEDTHKLIFPEYILLVKDKYAPADGDSAIHRDRKKEKIANREGLTKSAEDIVEALQKSLE